MSESPKKYGGFTIEQLKEVIGPAQPYSIARTRAWVALPALIEEIERLREAVERACDEISTLRYGRRETVLRLRSALSDTTGEE